MKIAGSNGHRLASATFGTNVSMGIDLPDVLDAHQPSQGKALSFNGLLTNRILTALPGDDFAYLLPKLEPIAFVERRECYRLATTPEFVIFPETAVFSHISIFEDGTATGGAIIGNDGIVGLSHLFNSAASPQTTEVTVTGNALKISLELMKEEFARGGAMQKLVLEYASKRLAQLSQRAVCNTRHMLAQRLCSWLLMVKDRTGLEQLPLTHEQMSAHLGARRAGVTASCNALRTNGIIEYRRGNILIKDRQGLEASACECYRILKN